MAKNKANINYPTIEQIINVREPKGCFGMLLNNGKVLAIDNEKNGAYCEEFENIDAAHGWLNHEFELNENGITDWELDELFEALEINKRKSK